VTPTTRNEAMITDGLTKNLGQVCLGLGSVLAYSYQAFATKNVLDLKYIKAQDKRC
jgi:hypothetical protein